MQEEQLYDRLAERLSVCMIGAPRTKELLGLLRTYFTPQDIRCAEWLSFNLEDLETISGRAGIGLGELMAALEGMADRGLVYRGGSQEKPTYCLFPTMVGLFETPFWPGKDSATTKKLARQWVDYYDAGYGDEATGRGTALTRVVAVEQAIADTREVAPFEIASEIIRSQTYLAVAHCPCRVVSRLAGQGCSHPEEVCLLFGKMSQFLVEKGFAKQISTEEALDIVKQTEEAGLVHTVDNMEQRTSVLCSCCPCCCVQLKGITRLGKRSAVAASRFYMQSDPDSCTGCATCVDRCPVGAIVIEEDHSVVDREVCIGCGLCTSTCPTGSAVLMVRDEVAPLPKTSGELRARILAEKGRLH